MIPPTIARCSRSSLSTCQTYTPHITSPSRLFSSSTSLYKIGPESPKFIEIPQSVQPYAVRPRQVKGVLPVPRNLFGRTRRGIDKTSTAYLAAVTPEPHTERALRETNDSYVNWKRSMAANRRENLREGLVALNMRKIKDDQKVAFRSNLKQEDRHRRVYAPPREDERLTSPTILASTKTPNSGRLPDPEREARIAASKQAVADKAAELRERRADALHSLYMNARQFITTEAQAEAKINELFTEQPFAHVPGKEYATNVWDAYGAPPSTETMLRGPSRSDLYMDQNRKPYLKNHERMIRLAEELTGGKMD